MANFNRNSGNSTERTLLVHEHQLYFCGFNPQNNKLPLHSNIAYHLGVCTSYIQVKYPPLFQNPFIDLLHGLWSANKSMLFHLAGSEDMMDILRLNHANL
jgi:hypothetical protein